MSLTVAVLGAGYAGVGAVQRLDEVLPRTTELVWISDQDYHLVLHEVHRCIRDPAVKESVTIPISAVSPSDVTFVQDEVTGLDTDARRIELADHDDVSYDYVLVALGSQTAFYGIPGLEDNALTLKSLDDALAIHDAVQTAASKATRDDPAQVVVGGAGLSGIQAAGEIAEYRDKHNAPIDIYLVEALEEIYPGNDPEIQEELRAKLTRKDITILTDDPIVEATDTAVQFEERDALAYDVLVWTGGITGRDAMGTAGVEHEHNRLSTDATFQTSNDHVFAVGDSALVDGGEIPPTAQAAWQAADVAAENIGHAIRDEPLDTYTHTDKGTAISVGDDAVAHDVMFLPIDVFGSLPAVTLKKLIAARWIADISDTKRAMRAWGDL